MAAPIHRIPYIGPALLAMGIAGATFFALHNATQTASRNTDTDLPKAASQNRAANQVAPSFPWPPPLASAVQVLPGSLLAHRSGVHTFGDIDYFLTAALEAEGYSERSYYSVPDGYALVTRLEQIDANGTAKSPPARWAANVRPMPTFTLRNYLEALLTAPTGRFRVLVFVVTDTGFSEKDEPVSREATLKWLHSGFNVLPELVAGQNLPANTTCTVLIYEFLQNGTSTSALVIPSQIDAHSHLVRAGIWKALGGR